MPPCNILPSHECTQIWSRKETRKIASLSPRIAAPHSHRHDKRRYWGGEAEAEQGNGGLPQAWQIPITWQRAYSRKKVMSNYRKGYACMN